MGIRQKTGIMNFAIFNWQWHSFCLCRAKSIWRCTVACCGFSFAKRTLPEFIHTPLHITLLGIFIDPNLSSISDVESIVGVFVGGHHKHPVKVGRARVESGRFSCIGSGGLIISVTIKPKTKLSSCVVSSRGKVVTGVKRWKYQPVDKVCTVLMLNDRQGVL